MNIHDNGTLESLIKNQKPLPKVVNVSHLPLDDPTHRIHSLGELSDLYQDEMAHIDQFLLRYYANFRQVSKYNCDILVQIAHQIMEDFLSTATDIKKPVSKSTKEYHSGVVTSPRRSKIREYARKRGLENAEKMKRKYAKRKRVELVDFQIGQNVTVRIPKEDRTSTDNRRLECVIVGKKKNKIPLYQLLCKHGTLDRWLTVSELLPYACPVSIDSDAIDSRTAVTLRQAARLSSQSKELNYCKCKAHSKSMMCKCRKLSKLCSSRCHRGIGCQNKTEVSKLSLPSTAKHSSKKNILSTNKDINAVLTSKDSGSESETASSCQHMTSFECPDTSQIVTTSLKTSGKIPITESVGPVPDKSRVDAQDPKYSHLPKQPKPTTLKQNMVDSSSNHPCSAPCSKDQQSSNNRSAIHSDVRTNLHSATLKSAKDFHTATLTHQSSAPQKLQGLLLPHFGGQFTCKNNSDSATIMNLANTCPVDTWLMFLKTFSVEKPDAFKTFADKCGQAKASISSLLQYVQGGHYTQGKCLICCIE